MLNILSYLRGAYANEGDENSLIVASSGYSVSAQKAMPCLTKIDAAGNITSKLITEFEYSTNVDGSMSDAEGNIYILGDTANEEGIACPMILKIDSDLQVKKAFVQEIDVYCPLYCGAVDEQGRIFVVGNTWYHGMLFVYDKDFNMLGYHIYDSSTSTQSVYQSLSLTSEGNALITASYMDEEYNNSSLIICYNDKAELEWQYNQAYEGNGYYYLYDAAQYGDNIIAVGYCNSSLGAQNYVMVLNEDHEIQKEYYTPQDKGYASYSFRYADIVNGNAYISFAYSLGKAMFGNLTCFGDKTTTGIEPALTSVESNGIVMKDGQVRLADNTAALWEVYTTDGAKVMSLNATEINLNSLTRGMYIVSAKNANKAYTLKVMR